MSISLDFLKILISTKKYPRTNNSELEEKKKLQINNFYSFKTKMDSQDFPAQEASTEQMIKFIEDHGIQKNYDYWYSGFVQVVEDFQALEDDGKPLPKRNSAYYLKCGITPGEKIPLKVFIFLI